MNPTLDINILKFENLAVFSPRFSMRFTALCRTTFVQCTEIRISTRYHCLQGTTYAYATEKKNILNILINFILTPKIFVFQFVSTVIGSF